MKFNRSKALRWPSVFVSILMLGGSLFPALTRAQVPDSGESDIKAAVQKFFAAIESKDIDALMSLWSAQSPELNASNEQFRKTFSTPEEAGHKAFSIIRVDRRGEKAAVRVRLEAEGTAGSAKTAGGKTEPANRTIDLVNEDGNWKVWGYDSSEDHLADELASAGSDQEFQKLLDRDKDLVNTRLSASMTAAADKLYRQGQYDQALELFRRTKQIAEQVNDKSSLAGVYFDIGNIQRRRALFKDAMAQYQESLRLSEEISDDASIARAYNGMAGTYSAQGDFAAAMQLIQRTLEIWRKLGDKKGMAAALNNLGLFQSNQGHYTDAIENYEESHRLSEEAGDLQTLPVTLMNIARVYEIRGDYPGALERYRSALKIAEEANIKPRVAEILTNMVVVLIDQGNLVNAAQTGQQCLTMWEQLGNKPWMLVTLHNLALAQFLLGNYIVAHQFFQRALSLEQEVGNTFAMADTLDNLGHLYEASGNSKLALECFERSLTFSNKSGRDAAYLGRLADVQMRKGEIDKARSSYKESAELSEQSGNRAQASSTLTNLGTLELAAGNMPQALEFLQKALAYDEQLGNPGTIAADLLNIAKVRNAAGAYSEAIQAASKSAKLAGEIGSAEGLFEALDAEGVAYFRTGRLIEASDAFTRAISVVERMRNNAAGSEQDRQRFMESRMAPYYSMTSLLIEQKNYAEALSSAERSKARVLIDIMESGRPSVTKAMSSEEKAHELDINTRLASLDTQIVKEKVNKEPDQKRLSHLNSQLDKTRAERDSFQTELYSAHPELRSQRARFQPISLSDCAGFINDRKTALLEFVVCDDQTYLFVITHGRASALPELNVIKIGVNSKTLAELCSQFREGLAHESLDFAPLSRKLYDVLLGGAIPILSSATNLVIVPDGPLWEVPFQALQSHTGHYLVEDKSISYAPSLTALREMSKPKPEGKTSPKTMLLALGNPALGKDAATGITQVFMDADLAPLPQAETQVQELGKLYGSRGSKVYIEAEATKARFKSEAPASKVLHIAAHGIVNNASPMYSQILLSSGSASEDNGVLEAWEVMDMDLSADLAVLAACDTGRGRYGAGEGMIGLSWAFFVAGCPATVVSQWSVEAGSTTELMVEFHRNLISGLSKAEALRRAELKLLKGDPAHRHPFYWAPFVVIGDGR